MFNIEKIIHYNNGKELNWLAALIKREQIRNILSEHKHMWTGYGSMMYLNVNELVSTHKKGLDSLYEDYKRSHGWWIGKEGDVTSFLNKCRKTTKLYLPNEIKNKDLKLSGVIATQMTIDGISSYPGKLDEKPYGRDEQYIRELFSKQSKNIKENNEDFQAILSHFTFDTLKNRESKIKEHCNRVNSVLSDVNRSMRFSDYLQKQIYQNDRGAGSMIFFSIKGAKRPKNIYYIHKSAINRGYQRDVEQFYGLFDDVIFNFLRDRPFSEQEKTKFSKISHEAASQIRKKWNSKDTVSVHEIMNDDNFYVYYSHSRCLPVKYARKHEKPTLTPEEHKQKLAELKEKLKRKQEERFRARMEARPNFNPMQVVAARAARRAPGIAA